MAHTTIKVRLPYETCEQNILCFVSKPSIINFYHSLSEVENNYPSNNGNSVMKIFKLNGSLYNLYGSGLPNYSLRKYNSSSQTWEPIVTIPNLPVYNASIAASELGTNDCIYFYGGQSTSDSTYVNTLYKYDVASNTTTLVGSGGTARTDACVTVSSDGTKFFAFSGGNYLAVFNECTISSNTWVSRPATPDGRIGGSLISLGTDLYLYGATYANNYINAKKLYKFDTVSNTWSFIVDGPTDADLTAFLFTDGTDLYLNSFYGELDGNNFIYKYDLVDNLCNKVIGIDPNRFDEKYMKASMRSVKWFDNKFWFTGYLTETINGEICGDLYGTFDISSHTLQLLWSDLGYLSMTMTSSILQVTPAGDTPEKIRYEFFNSAMTSFGVFEYPIGQNQTINPTNYYYEGQLPTAIKKESVYYLKIVYKTVNSDWSPWSNLYSVYGGGE